MPDSRSLEFTCTVKAVPEEAYRAFTHATLLRDWLGTDASSVPQKGDHLFVRFRAGENAEGTYTKLDSPRQLCFTWRGTKDITASNIQVDFTSEGEGTHVTLTQEPQVEDATWDETAARWSAVWPAALENLASVLETGIDLRQARRPRMGIIMHDDLPAEFLEQSGVPVKSGVRLAGVADGSGSQAAGLQKDDVLVSLNGVALEDPPSITPILSECKAGDRLQVEYYRGAHKQSATVELGHFPVPELPGSAAELASKVRELSAGVLTAMREQVGGLTDEQASRKPAAEEWSAREVVAHFVLCERDYQTWVASMLVDGVIEDWLENRPNVTPRLVALTVRLPKLADLLDELALAYEESARMIEALPETLVQRRKHLFRRAAAWEIEFIPGHYFEEHKDQLQAAIESGKA